MAQKSRDLDRQLAEILTPLGFKKVPKTRYFIRLCGDGVLQGVRWYHEPRYIGQALEIWINSVYTDPDDLFRNYLSWHDLGMMLCSIECTSNFYGENEFIPTRKYRDCTEEEQLVYLEEQVLPRFERWQTPEDVFHARQGAQMATAEGYPLHEPWYHFGRELNLALYLNLPDEVEKYLNKPIAFEQHREDVERERGNPKNEATFRREKESFIQRKAFFDGLRSPNDAKRYFCLCKEQNLNDYERILKGDRGELRFFMSNGPAIPFYRLVLDGEKVPVFWKSDT